ncbi:hypothetical protein HF325_005366 [Metschnikowia pulcherrima]|uniref:Uncharacterized protein n=1 Tax=Metschnikowia pulcherrima TaxID=27326 RepID=A0A8H7GNZ1_9ASCO|nr:hypothetical protein HF325_005366 [Metschnikowia pulcherrima]
MAVEFAKTRLYKLRHLNPKDKILSDGELLVGVNCASVLDGREFLALIVMRPFLLRSQERDRAPHHNISKKLRKCKLSNVYDRLQHLKEQVENSPNPFWVAHASSARIRLHSKSH